MTVTLCPGLDNIRLASPRRFFMKCGRKRTFKCALLGESAPTKPSTGSGYGTPLTSHLVVSTLLKSVVGASAYAALWNSYTFEKGSALGSAKSTG